MKTNISLVLGSLSLMLLFACSHNGFLGERKIASDPANLEFSRYVQQYKNPQYIEDNPRAFDIRLKLLDMAPEGGKVKIATFVFDNGKVVRQLARHICLAEARGVNVELLVDSKSGDRVGVEDPFDKKEESQVVEELYQYMANCGASVYVHNHLDSFIDVIGQRLPNFLLDKSMDGKSYSYLNFITLLGINSQITSLVNKIGDLANKEFLAAGTKVDVTPLLFNLKSFATEYLHLLEITANRTNVDAPNDNYDRSVELLRRKYLSLVRDEAWSKITTEQFRVAIPKIVAAFHKDPQLSQIRLAIHRFNRLNHRKLFLAENADGTQGCMALGGRNLGDHYLNNSRDSFLDGDIFLCRHQSEEQNKILNEANLSFEELKNDLSDNFMGLNSDNIVRLIPRNPGFKFSALSIPDDLAPKGAKFERYRGSIDEDERKLLPEKKWEDASAIQGELELAGTKNWRLLRTNWDPANDQVMQNFLSMIRSEKKEIFIETAYGEFNQELRTALEQALDRGVNVRFITNSFFISDGGSKVIRILMANWIETTKIKFPKNFQVRFTTFSSGHMSHFKGAAFACQPKEGAFVRSYLLGSHNFHPRSGRADKEHALTWDQADSCSAGFKGLNDIVESRSVLYSHLAKLLKRETLEYYPSFLSEIAEVKNLGGKLGTVQSKLVARAFLLALYKQSSSAPPKLLEEEKIKSILKLLDESGLHDLLGQVL